MNKSKYRCSICSKKLNRKWNVHRHNNDLHKGTAYINYSLKSGITPINKRPKINRYNFTTISKFKDFDDNLENNLYSPSPFKLFNKVYQKKSSKSVLLMNEDEKENLLYID